MSNAATPDLELFLAESAWLRQLAASLASPEEADDLVQSAYERLLTDPPRHAASPRGWLATVVNNARRMRRRTDARRNRRELRSDEVREVPSVEALAARAQTLGLLARIVNELDEPFRRVVLLHYCEGSTLAEIARAEGCPAATVRGRLRTGLARLRGRLDQEHGGKRAVWMSAFAPLAPRPAVAGSPWLAWGTAAAVAVGLGIVAVNTTTADPTDARREPAAHVTVTVADPPSSSASTVTAVDGIAASTPQIHTRRTPTPALPPDAPLRSEGDRATRLQAIHAARLARLRDAGLDDDVVGDAAKDAKLLGDIETMMMLEGVAELADGCREAAPPIRGTTRVVDIELVGEPDVGTVIEHVQLRKARHALPDAWAGCVVESLYLLSLPPPPRPGTQSMAFEFRADDQGAVMTAPHSEVEAPAQ